MHAATALLDVLDRTRTSLDGLLTHCRTLTPDELDRELDGFGYPTVRLQLHHVVGAQKYWLSVLEDRMDASENDADYPTVASLEAFLDEVHTATANYLRETSDNVLNTRRAMTTWRGSQSIVPAHVVLRTQVHAFQHFGQVTAMCRLLGHPVPTGMDFSLD